MPWMANMLLYSPPPSNYLSQDFLSEVRGTSLGNWTSIFKAGALNCKKGSPVVHAVWLDLSFLTDALPRMCQPVTGFNQWEASICRSLPLSIDQWCFTLTASPYKYFLSLFIVTWHFPVLSHILDTISFLYRIYIMRASLRFKSKYIPFHRLFGPYII